MGRETVGGRRGTRLSHQQSRRHTRWRKGFTSLRRSVPSSKTTGELRFDCQRVDEVAVVFDIRVDKRQWRSPERKERIRLETTDACEGLDKEERVSASIWMISKILLA